MLMTHSTARIKLYKEVRFTNLIGKIREMGFNKVFKGVINC